MSGIFWRAELPDIKGVPNDPTDNMLVATAVATNADYLVTGGRRRLLPLGGYEGMKIVTPRDSLDQTEG